MTSRRTLRDVEGLVSSFPGPEEQAIAREEESEGTIRPRSPTLGQVVFLECVQRARSELYEKHPSWSRALEAFLSAEDSDFKISREHIPDPGHGFYANLAKEFEVDPGTVRNWLRKAYRWTKERAREAYLEELSNEQD